MVDFFYLPDQILNSMKIGMLFDLFMALTQVSKIVPETQIFVG